MLARNPSLYTTHRLPCRRDGGGERHRNSIAGECRERHGLASAEYRDPHRDVPLIAARLKNSRESRMSERRKAWVTLLSNADYIEGVVALMHSLDLVETDFALIVMLTFQLEESQVAKLQVGQQLEESSAHSYLSVL
eukprot:6182979-Pleurochrysis_carterae.AAC.2